MPCPKGSQKPPRTAGGDGMTFIEIKEFVTSLMKDVESKDQEAKIKELDSMVSYLRNEVKNLTTDKIKLETRIARVKNFLNGIEL